ncbi:helix-turn-helix domain-containing protein [Streptomyces caniferus]|uniref:winged helix-turn-helix transcriptional regulator n=1 Tax=Streptomyces caniferus TaxID=285557 RepID=UPI0034529563
MARLSARPGRRRTRRHRGPPQPGQGRAPSLTPCRRLAPPERARRPGRSRHPRPAAAHPPTGRPLTKDAGPRDPWQPGPAPWLTADAERPAAFEILGQKWTGIILHTLATRPARYGELSTAIEHISTKMLADRQRELVEAGLVTHDQLPPGPATYTLTADGRALLPVMVLRSPRLPRQSGRRGQADGDGDALPT